MSNGHISDKLNKMLEYQKSFFSFYDESIQKLSQYNNDLLMFKIQIENLEDNNIVIIQNNIAKLESWLKDLYVNIYKMNDIIHSSNESLKNTVIGFLPQIKDKIKSNCDTVLFDKTLFSMCIEMYKESVSQLEKILINQYKIKQHMFTLQIAFFECKKTISEAKINLYNNTKDKLLNLELLYKNDLVDEKAMIDNNENEKALIEFEKYMKDIDLDLDLPDNNNAINEIEAYITLSKTDSKINKLANDVHKCKWIIQEMKNNILDNLSTYKQSNNSIKQQITNLLSDLPVINH
jgi:hypothetical protein